MTINISSVVNLQMPVRPRQSSRVSGSFCLRIHIRQGRVATVPLVHWGEYEMSWPTSLRAAHGVDGAGLNFCAYFTLIPLFDVISILLG